MKAHVESFAMPMWKALQAHTIWVAHAWPPSQTMHVHLWYACYMHAIEPEMLDLGSWQQYNI